MVNRIVLGEYDYNYTIDDSLLHKYQNVTSYKYALCRPQLELTVETKDFVSQDKDIYYIFDCPG